MTEHTKGRTRRTLQRVGALGAVLALSTVAWASPALAAGTSQATAEALNATIGGSTLLSTGTSAATNDGSMGLVTKTKGPIAILPGQTTANTGVVSQTANASDMATSSACAGAVGSGGALTVGNDGTCTLTGGAQPPLLINLGSGLTLTASAIYAQCTAGPSGTGPFTASSTLANVFLNLAVLPGAPPVQIPIDVSNSFTIPGGPLIVVTANQTTGVGVGPTTTATALNIMVGPNGSLANVTIGQVTCGANATVVDIPMVPLQGAGVAGLTALVVGAGYLALRRRTSNLA